MKLSKVQKVMVALGIIPEGASYIYTGPSRELTKVFYEKGVWYAVDSRNVYKPIVQIYPHLRKQFFDCCRVYPHRLRKFKTHT